MTLPDTIPKRLRDQALFLPEFEEGEGAWFKVDAIAVIESLEGATVPISKVDIFKMAPGKYMPIGMILLMERFPNEADTDYAARSQSAALDFIQNSEMLQDDTLFALSFPLWKNAA